MSAGQPSPVAGAPGVIVRIRLSQNVMYSSKRLPLAEAHETAEYVRGVLRANQGFVRLPKDKFPPADLDELSIRTASVLAVEVRCVNADGSLIPAAAPEIRAVSA